MSVRCEHQMLFDMINSANDRRRKTHLANALRTNMNITQKLIDKALVNGLLEKEGDFYNRTFKGNQFLLAFRGMNWYLNTPILKEAPISPDQAPPEPINLNAFFEGNQEEKREVDDNEC